MRKVVMSFGILLTGTPGSGKTTLASKICEAFKQNEAIEVYAIDLSAFAIENGACEKSFDDERQCNLLDERLLIRKLRAFKSEKRQEVKEKGKNCAVFIFDYHSGGNGLFPNHWIDRCYTIRCDTALIYDRLRSRGYVETKIRENVQCEIMGISYEDSCEDFGERTVEISGDSVDELEHNVRVIKAWIEKSWEDTREEKQLES